MMQSQNRKKRQRAKRKENKTRLEEVLEMLKLKRHDWVVMNNYTYLWY